MKFHYLIIILLISELYVNAQTINVSKLDSLFESIYKNNKGMGSIAISKNGKLVYKKAIGYKLINRYEKIKIPLDEDTKFRIGSISKMFTAVLTFQLIENGKLKLTTTLDKFFPNLPNAKRITISHLLYHRSGLHNFTDDADYLTWNEDPKSHEDMLNIIANKKVDFPPDSTAEYSNSNFVVLGYIIEKIYKKPYATILQERIVSKIGLTHTYYGKKTNIEDNECYSYEFSFDLQNEEEELDSKKGAPAPTKNDDAYLKSWAQSTETDMSIPHGAGAIVSTPTDLTKFINALFSYKLISKKSVNAMKTIQDGYGMGMFEYPFDEKKAYGHTGGIDGFHSTLSFFPQDSLAIAYCSNGNRYAMNNIEIGVLKIYFHQPYSIPMFKEINLSLAELNKYVGLYAPVSDKFPLKIRVGVYENQLIAKGTDQPPFGLTATSNNVFEYEPAGVVMEFFLEKNELILTQGGQKFTFKRE